MVTKTAVIVICEEEILIWAIPPLSPQPPDFFDHNPTHIPPFFIIPFPQDIILHTELVDWKTISSWYFGSSQPLYFDMLCQSYKLHRFQIIVKPDLSDASLHIINTSELTPYDFEDESFQSYRICEDTLVSCWTTHDPPQCGAYTGLTSARSAHDISYGGPAAKMPIAGYESVISFCPASGRFVHLDSGGLAVLDFF
jgi:hypothetical protein